MERDRVMPLDADGLSKWFDEYLDTFAACARGDREIGSLLAFYGVPFIVTSDDGVTVLNSASGLYRGTFSRRDRNDGEIANVTVTYVATDGPAGLRISLPAAHGDF